MRALGLLIFAVLVVAAATVSGAAARPVQQCAQPDAGAVVQVNVEHPLRDDLMGIGQSGWHKSLWPFPKGPLCGISSDKASARLLRRFYVLFMAFPAKPTRAQWNVRFEPLIDAAIGFDSHIVAIGGPYAYGSYPGADLTWLRSIRSSVFGAHIA